jgi:hypothetical protein
MTMKIFCIFPAAVLMFICIAIINSKASASEVKTAKKPRVIATTDGEIEEQE